MNITMKTGEIRPVIKLRPNDKVKLPDIYWNYSEPQIEVLESEVCRAICSQVQAYYPDSHYERTDERFKPDEYTYARDTMNAAYVCVMKREYGKALYWARLSYNATLHEDDCEINGYPEETKLVLRYDRDTSTWLIFMTVIIKHMFGVTSKAYYVGEFIEEADDTPLETRVDQFFQYWQDKKEKDNERQRNLVSPQDYAR